MFWRRKEEAEFQPVEQTQPIIYPTGLCVATPEEFYYIRGNEKYRLASDRALRSWKFDSIAWATTEALKQHKLAGVLGFRDGTVLRDISDGKLYLVSESKVRHIETPDIFERFGLDRAQIIDVSHAEVKVHKSGEVLK